jgi:hypothetical protein
MDIPQELLLPTREQYVNWAQQCFQALDARPSNFLLDGRASSKNRTAVLLASRTRLNMVVARELQVELNSVARQRGIELPSLWLFPGAGENV